MEVKATQDEAGRLYVHVAGASSDVGAMTGEPVPADKAQSPAEGANEGDRAEAAADEAELGKQDRISENHGSVVGVKGASYLLER